MLTDLTHARQSQRQLLDDRSLVVRPLTAAAEHLGCHPLAPLFALQYGRRGNLVNRIRRQTGLGKMPRARHR